MFFSSSGDLFFRRRCGITAQARKVVSQTIKPTSTPRDVVQMTTPNGRFRVRRGDLEIEYEGPNFGKEYVDALRYLGIADKAQIDLDETESLRAHTNSGPPAIGPSLSTSALPSSPSAIIVSTAGGVESTRAHDLESHGLDSSSPPERKADDTTEAGAPSEETPFDAFLRRIARAPEGSEERAEPKAKSGLSVSEDATPTAPGRSISEGATPSGQGDDKYKEVLKRLKLPS